MNLPIASKTRKQIRQSIGYGLGCLTILDATAIGSTSTILDDMLQGGEDDFKGFELLCISGTNDGARRKVTTFDGDETLTVKPVLGLATALGDDFELWTPPFTVAQIHQFIADSEIHCIKTVYYETSDTSQVKLSGIYEYTIPSTLEAIHTVEYVESIGIDHQLHSCDAVWDELVDGDVTASADTNFYKEGTGSLKLVVATLCGATDILATDNISEVDISDCDCITAWIYSTSALTANYLQILLSNTASCASLTEALNIPAVSANTWTRISIDLANPPSDTAIISTGLKMVTDVGAFTLYVDDIRAQKKDSRQYKILSPNCWEIIDGSSPKLKLTSSGYNLIGDNELFRLSGYREIAQMSADTSSSEIDPDYIVEYALAKALLSVAKREDEGDSYRRAREHYQRALMLLNNMQTSCEPNTRFLQR